MHVLNVNVTLDAETGGGTAERTFRISRALRNRSCECTILTMDRGLTRERRDELLGVGVVGLPFLSRRYNIPSRGRREIREAVANADVVHLMGHWNILNVLVAREARRQRKPYVVCPAGELANFGRSRMLKALFHSAFGRRIVREAAGAVAITPVETPQFEQSGIDPSRVVVIPNGVDPAEYTDPDVDGFRERHGLGRNPVLLFVGRLNPIKGPDLLLNAFAQVAGEFSEHQLVFAGPDGGMKAALEQSASEMEIGDRVRFIGYIGGNDKASAYHSADLLVIPSRKEAMSIVVLEAGAAGTPVLLTDQCGFDAVEEVGGGRVVYADTAGLADGLRQMLQAPDELSRSGARLRKFVVAEYSWDVAVDRLLALFGPLVVRAERERAV